MSSALHAALMALLWLSMGLWPVRAEALAQDDEAHACRSDLHAPDVGNTSESPEPVEVEDEDDDIHTASPARAAPLALDVPDLRATCRGSATWAREIYMAGGSIRGPPIT